MTTHTHTHTRTHTPTHPHPHTHTHTHTHTHLHTPTHPHTHTHTHISDIGTCGQHCASLASGIRTASYHERHTLTGYFYANYFYTGYSYTGYLYTYYSIHIYINGNAVHTNIVPVLVYASNTEKVSIRYGKY